jgi:hypothetical protein
MQSPIRRHCKRLRQGPAVVRRGVVGCSNSAVPLQAYATGGEESEMKSNSWWVVLACLLPLAGAIAISAGTGHAEERNYSVAALGTSASPLGDSAHSATHNKLRKGQKVALRGHAR